MALKPKDPLTEATEQLQRELLRKVLEESEWNIVEVARRLGLSRTKPKGPPRGGGPKVAAAMARPRPKPVDAIAKAATVRKRKRKGRD